MIINGGKTDWPSQSVAQIRSIASSFMAEGANADALALLNVADALEQGGAAFLRAVDNASAGISGDAAAAMQNAARRGFQHVIDTSNSSGEIGQNLHNVSLVLESSKSAAEVGIAGVEVTQAVEPSTAAETAAAKNALDEAMNSVYSNPMVGANSSLPSVPASDLDPGGGTLMPNSGTGSNGPGGSGSSNDSSSGGGTTSPNNLGPNDASGLLANQKTTSSNGSDPTSDAAQAANDALQNAGDQLSQGLDGSDPSGGSGPAGLTNTSNNGTLGPLSGRGTAGGGSGSGGSGGRGGGSGVTSSPLGAARTPATLTGAAPGAGTTGSGTPGSGGRTSPPMSPGSGARAAGKDEDRHKAAGYVHGRHNGEEMVGPLPLVTPAVLGDWTPPPAETEDKNDDSPDKPLNLT